VAVGDEPTNGELGRRLNDIAALLRDVVGSREYAADQRAIDRRLAALDRDFQDFRVKHAEDIRAVDARITSEVERVDDRINADHERAETNKHSWRNALWVGVFPALVVAAEWIFNLLTHGGKP
jgi:hypothetical protein